MVNAINRISKRLCKQLADEKGLSLAQAADYLIAIGWDAWIGERTARESNHDAILAEALRKLRRAQSSASKPPTA